MNDKPRLVPITYAEYMQFELNRGELNVPVAYRGGGGYWADADELRAWRASQNTSDGEQR